MRIQQVNLLSELLRLSLELRHCLSADVSHNCCSSASACKFQEPNGVDNEACHETIGMGTTRPALRREKAAQTKWQLARGAGCARSPTASGRGRKMSLDIPFYRTSQNTSGQARRTANPACLSKRSSASDGKPIYPNLTRGRFLAAIPELQPRPITGSPFVHHSSTQSPNRMTQMASRSRADYSVAIMHGTQVVLVDRRADSAAQGRASVLVGSKMYAAVDASVGYVVGNLLERGVLQDDCGHCGV